MKCPLCGSENQEAAERCCLCDTSFASDELSTVSPSAQDYIVMDTVDATSCRVSKSKVGGLLAILSFLLLPWILMSDLLSTPKDVLTSREGFHRVHERYVSNKEQWSHQKAQLLATMHQAALTSDLSNESIVLDKLPLELFVAILEEDLGLSAKGDSSFALFPKEKTRADPTIILSKREPGVWPLSIVASLEVSIVNDQHGLSPRLMKLRRGSREVSTDLAWLYFGTELCHLQQLSRLSGSMSNFHLYRDPQATDTADHDIKMGWHYSGSRAVTSL